MQVHPNAFLNKLLIDQDTTDDAYRNTITTNDVPTEIRRYCFSFLGTRNHINSAGTSRFFRREYLDMSKESDVNVTTVDNVVSPIPRIELYIHYE